MGKFIDLTGQRFGRWLVLKRAPNDRRNHTNYICRCDCGTERIIESSNLKSGASKSCGCFKRENQKPPPRWPKGKSRIAQYNESDPERGVRQTSSGRWQFQINGDKMPDPFFLSGTYDTKEEALLARRQAVVDLCPFHESSVELEQEIPTNRKTRLYDIERPRVSSDWPNVRFDASCTWRPWNGRVSSGCGADQVEYSEFFETELKAALWAVNKKLELGHGPRARLEARKAAILEAMKEELL